MTSRFKVDLINHSAADMEVKLFSNELQTTDTASIYNTPAAAFAGYITEEGYHYRALDNSTIVVMDRNNKLLGTYDAPQLRLDTCVYNPFNQAVYFLSTSKKLYVLKGLQFNVVAIPYDANFIALNTQNNCLYFGGKNGINEVFTVDPIFRVSSFVVTGQPQNVSLYALGVYHPVKNKIYFSNESNNHLLVLDCASNTVTSEIIPIGQTFGGVFNPVNNKLYIPSFQAINCIDLSDKCEVLLTTQSRFNFNGVYNEKEQSVCFTARGTTSKLYSINASNQISELICDAPYGLAYNEIDCSIFLTTDNGISVIQNNTLIDTYLTGSQLFFPLTDPLQGKVYSAFRNQNRILIYQKKSLEFASAIPLDQLNRQINAGLFLVDEMKIRSNDLSQFSYPLKLIKKNLVGRSEEEPIFPINQLSDGHCQNIVVLTKKELNAFHIGSGNSLGLTVCAGNSMSLTVSLQNGK